MQITQLFKEGMFNDLENLKKLLPKAKLFGRRKKMLQKEQDWRFGRKIE
jgi:hypothetical protein